LQLGTILTLTIPLIAPLQICRKLLQACTGNFLPPQGQVDLNNINSWRQATPTSPSTGTTTPLVGLGAVLLMVS